MGNQQSNDNTCGMNTQDFNIAVRHLEENNIQTRVVFTGNIVRQPMCNGKKMKLRETGYKNADLIMRQGVLLPVHHGLSGKMLNHIWDTIEKFLIENRYID